MSKNYLEEIAKISEAFDEQNTIVIANYEEIKIRATNLIKERIAFVKELERLLRKENDKCLDTFNELSCAGLVDNTLLEEEAYFEDEDEEDEFEDEEKYES